ncbi:MAG: CoA transferase, partial [Candidatus Binatia bacterium]
MAQALSHFRVVEVGEAIASAHAAKLLADLGADVVKVESPAGDPARRSGPFPGDRVDPEASGLYLYLNCNKRGITLDLEASKDRAVLAALLDRADLLIHS